jgi:hypothetical protein
LLAFNPAEFAAEPGIGFAGFGMNASDDDLRAVGQEFDLFAFAAVRRDQTDVKFLEWPTSAAACRPVRRSINQENKL